ncbi:hypothetical protein [Paremcibacter congregatus]|uniref:hypothetical protein n=1 Tax=Paremcibacter congregatus TaxID=2043170 RepID=UPI0030EED452|tara:strand:+ start:2071 stop:2457 length:387 start_codon:yes stop_codon:yes gene_type:complete
MNARQSSQATASAAWGPTTTPDWILALAKACDDHQSQKKAGDLVGYSGATINLVLKNKYNGDLSKVEVMVRGALLKESVNCPVLGILNLKECRDYQALKTFSGTTMGVFLKRACPKCAYNQENENGNQ